MNPLRWFFNKIRRAPTFEEFYALSERRDLIPRPLHQGPPAIWPFGIQESPGLLETPHMEFFCEIVTNDIQIGIRPAHSQWELGPGDYVLVASEGYMPHIRRLEPMGSTVVFPPDGLPLPGAMTSVLADVYVIHGMGYGGYRLAYDSASRSTSLVAILRPDDPVYVAKVQAHMDFKRRDREQFEMQMARNLDIIHEFPIFKDVPQVSPVEEGRLIKRKDRK